MKYEELTGMADLPPALEDGSRFIHIGMPKTGTTSLQAALHAQRDELEALGVHNVSRQRNELKTAMLAADTLPAYQTGFNRDRWPELAAEFRSSQARCTFWSSEGLSQAKADRLPHIAEMLGNDLTVVVTYRSLAEMVTSQWQEWLRRRGTASLEDWLAARFDEVTPTDVLAEPVRKHLPVLHRFSLSRVVREWGSVFGADRIVFVIGEPGNREWFLRSFGAMMGVGELLEQTPTDNASLPYPEAEMLRAFNRAYTAQGGTHAVWMRAIGNGARPALRQFTSELAPQPIQMPRWAAERCNEYAAAWIDAVRSSDAKVVGDLDNLVVDTERYPVAAAPPRQADIESAGMLANIVFQAGLNEGRSEAPSVAGGGGRPADLSLTPGRELLRELGRRAKRRFSRR